MAAWLPPGRGKGPAVCAFRALFPGVRERGALRMRRPIIGAACNALRRAPLVGIALACALPGTPPARATPKSDARCCRLIRTDFGYLWLAPHDIPLGMKAGNQVARAAKELFRVPHVRFAIVDARHTKYRWGATRPDGLAVYPWSFVHGTNYVAVQPPNAILPHEMGHDLLRRYAIPSTHPGQYGTDAPDWLDESVAVAFEAPEDRAVRRCEASALLKSGALIPLRRFLAMDHPDLAANRRALAGSGTGGLVFDSSASKDTPAFYAMSIAFPEYLAASTRSPAALAELVDTVRAGRAVGEWMSSRLGAPGQALDLDKLDRSFSAWLGSDARYRCHP
jgi:hypothetical protein